MLFMLGVLAGLFICLPSLVRMLDIPLNSPKSIILVKLLNLHYKFQSLLSRKQHAGKISKIHLHPIKSVSHLSVDSWEIDEFGLKYDRQYMFAFWDLKKQIYEPITLRNCKRLPLVNITVNLEENWFRFTYPYQGNLLSFKLPCEVSDDFIQKNKIEIHPTKTDLWGVHFETFNIGKAVPPEFFKAMEIDGRYNDLTLLYTKTPKKVKTLHPTDLKQQRKTQFQDYYPLHIITQDAINELNDRLKKDGFDRDIRPEQFRPNFVIDDVPKSIDLDEWYRVTLDTKTSTGIKEHKFKTAIRCQRCTIPNNNLDTGVYDKSNKVTKELAKYRKIDPASNGYFFGHYLIHYEYGYTVRVGDEFYLHQKRINPYEPMV